MEPQGLHENSKGRSTRNSSRGHFFFLLAVLLPIGINLFVFYSFVEPLKKKAAHLNSFTARAELKPRLEALIAESNKVMMPKVEGNLSVKDVGAILMEIRDMAKIHKVEVKDLRPRGSKTAPGASTDKTFDEALVAAGFKKVYLSLDVTGSYGGIARSCWTRKRISGWMIFY